MICSQPATKHPLALERASLFFLVILPDFRYYIVGAHLAEPACRTVVPNPAAFTLLIWGGRASNEVLFYWAECLIFRVGERGRGGSGSGSGRGIGRMGKTTRRGLTMPPAFIAFKNRGKTTGKRGNGIFRLKRVGS